MSDKSTYIGTHNGQKKGKTLTRAANPNSKIQARVAARLEAWERDAPKMATKGHQKPGSQAKVRT